MLVNQLENEFDLVGAWAGRRIRTIVSKGYFATCLVTIQNKNLQQGIPRSSIIHKEIVLMAYNYSTIVIDISMFYSAVGCCFK